jgi:HSP20 family protein
MLFTPVIRRSAYNPALHAMDRNLERFLRDAVFPAQTVSTPRGCSFEQDDTGYTLQLDVPGLAKSHLSIGIEGNVVRIESLADAPRTVKTAYELPQDIDTNTSEAKLENGVLTLKLTKKAPLSKVTSLSIN